MLWHPRGRRRGGAHSCGALLATAPLASPAQRAPHVMGGMDMVGVQAHVGHPQLDLAQGRDAAFPLESRLVLEACVGGGGEEGFECAGEAFSRGSGCNGARPQRVEGMVLEQPAVGVISVIRCEHAELRGSTRAKALGGNASGWADGPLEREHRPPRP